MKFKVLLLILLIIFPACNLYHKKTEKIGECTWFTEYGYLDALEKAKKENKPVFVYFTAKWCKVCKHYRKDVLETKEFKKIEEKAVLLKVEQSEPEGRRICRKYKVSVYPSFKLLDKNGKEINKGWHGYKLSMTADNVYKWLVNAKELGRPDFLTKPLPLAKLYLMFQPPFSKIRDLTFKERAEMLYNSLLPYAKKHRGLIEDERYFYCATHLPYYLQKAFCECNSLEERKEFASKVRKKEIPFILKKIKYKNSRELALADYYIASNQSEKALKIILPKIKKLRYIRKRSDISCIKNAILAYSLLLEREQESNSNLIEIGVNLREKSLKKKIDFLSNKLIAHAYIFKDAPSMYIAIFSSIEQILLLTQSMNNQELFNKILKKSFNALIETTDLKKTELLAKKIDLYSNEPNTFLILSYLDDFSGNKFVAEDFIKFGKKYYKQANISYKEDLIISVFKSYIALEEKKKALNFIKSVLKDKKYLAEIKKFHWLSAFYGKLAYACTTYNTLLNYGEKWANIAINSEKGHEKEYAYFALAMIKANKGDLQEAIKLGKIAYTKATLQEYEDTKLIENIKKYLKKWKKETLEK